MELIEGSEHQLWTCDLCGRHSVVGEKVQAWRCLQDKRSGGGCDFDICTRCIGEYKVYIKANTLKVLAWSKIAKIANF